MNPVPERVSAASVFPIISKNDSFLDAFFPRKLKKHMTGHLSILQSS
jgi:hypothetical protein